MYVEGVVIFDRVIPFELGKKLNIIMAIKLWLRAVAFVALTTRLVLNEI
jgi:branched-subunit amino acid transport protein